MSNLASPMEWSIRPYQPGDEAQLVALFLRVFGRAMTTAQWRWKLKRLPSPVENVWLAVHAGQPIFQYGGVPARFWIGQHEVTAMVSVDAMTAPEFQRRGLLSRVCELTFATWKGAGIPFTLGIPNERWGSRTVMLGWQALFRLHWYVFPVRLAGMLARRVDQPRLARWVWLDQVWATWWAWRNGQGSDVRVTRVETTGGSFDTLWQRNRADYAFSVCRDDAWVHWRYLSAPELGYQVRLAWRGDQPVGFAAFRTDTVAERRVGLLADLFTARGDDVARRALLSRVMTDLRGAGVQSIAALVIPTSALAASLRAGGFLRGRWGFTVHCVPFDSQLPLAQMRDPSQWHMTGGDFDVV